MSDAARILALSHGGLWGEHPDHSLSSWQAEVSNDDTRQSYWDWALHQVEQAEEV